MKRWVIIFVVAALICLLVPSAYAGWVIPQTATDVGVQSGQWIISSGSSLSVNFDSNSNLQGYSSLTQPSVTLSQGDYLLPYENFAVYDDDPVMAYYFGGWYTSPQGGQRVESGEDVLSCFTGQSSVTLYAHWLSKAILTVTLNDLSNFYDISFELVSGDNTCSLATSSQQTLEATYYLNPTGSWSVNASASNTSVTITSEQSSLEQGGTYSFTALVRTTIVNIPESFEQVTK